MTILLTLLAVLAWQLIAVAAVRLTRGSNKGWDQLFEFMYLWLWPVSVYGVLSARRKRRRKAQG